MDKLRYAMVGGGQGAFIGGVHRRAMALDGQMELVAGAYNVLPMDAAVFRAWARLMHRKSDTLYEDAMIAATAKVHGLTVVTRNVANFKALGFEVFNPFAAA